MCSRGQSEEDNEDPGLRVRVLVDTDEEFQDVVCVVEIWKGLFPWTFPSQVQRRRLRIIPVVAQDEVRLTLSTIPGVLPNAPEVHPGPTAVDAASTESIPDVEDQRMSAGCLFWEERDGASESNWV